MVLQIIWLIVLREKIFSIIEMSNNETEKDVESSDEAEVSEKHGDTNFDRECIVYLHSGLDSFNPGPPR